MLTCKNCGRQYDRNDHHGCCSSQCFDAWMLKNANTMANIKQAVELSEQTKILREMKAKEEAKERAEIAQQNAIRQQAMINEMQSHGYNDWEKYQKDLAYANRAGYATIEEQKLAWQQRKEQNSERIRRNHLNDARQNGFSSYPEYYAAKLKEQKEYIAHMDEIEPGISGKIEKFVTSIKKADVYYNDDYTAVSGSAIIIAIIGLLLKKFVGISILNYGYIVNGIFYFLLFSSLFLFRGLVLYCKVIKAVKIVRTTFADKVILLGRKTYDIPEPYTFETKLYALGASDYIFWSFTTWMAFILFSIGLFIFHLNIDGLLLKYSIGAGVLFLICIFFIFKKIGISINRSWNRKIEVYLDEFEKEMDDKIPND